MSMVYKNVKKGVEISTISLMLLGLIFLYIYKTLNFITVNELNNRVFYYIFIFAVILFTLNINLVLKGKKSIFTRVLFSCIEIGLIAYFIFIGDTATTWAYFLLSFVVIYSTFSYGRKYGFGILILGCLITGSALIYTSKQMGSQERTAEFFIIYAVIIYTIQVVVWYIASLLNDKMNIEDEKLLERQQLLDKGIDENNKLKEEINEFKNHNESLETANKRLELTNQKLNKSAAEFYTLQQISQAIATILDIKELLKFVNDVIIGVMGVNYCTILLLDKEKSNLSIKISNIYSEAALNTLNQNINCNELKDVIKTGKAIIENNVEQKKYSFTEGREIQSMLCIPLFSKNESYGVVLVEQERPDAFEDEHLKFLSAIGNQVSVALENVGLYEKMQKMATTDALTKIYNRLYFNEMLSKEMANADREKYPMSVAIFDIDHFKKFNDTYGHLFGDLVLKTIAKLAKDNVREQDLVARFGGEEFVIIMPNTKTDEAFSIVDDLREKISRCNVKEGSITASVTASFGVSCYPQHGSVEAEVLSAADTALYKAKMEGRNCVRIFEKP